MNFWTKHNHLKILEGGEEFFSRILKALDEAESEIILISYIFKADGIGNKVAKKLKEAVARGVSATLVVDGVGSKDLSEKWMNDLRRSGVSLVYFRPFNRFFSLGRIFFRRLHQKMLVIDFRLAFVGGINIEDAQYHQLDYAVLVEGPLALKIQKFVKLFVLRLRGQWIEYFQLRRLKVRRSASSSVDQTTHGKQTKAALVIRDNFRHRRQIEKLYLQSLSAAKSRVLIANAYFLPRYRFRRVLKAAARRGVRVQLVLQGQTDHPIMRNATALLYKELLRSGIEIYEYHREILHAKVAVIDGHWATIGSCNLDIFSLFLSLEANVVVDDTALSKELEGKLETAIRKNGVRIDESFFESKSPWDWVVCWLSLLVFRILRFVE